MNIKQQHPQWGPAKVQEIYSRNRGALRTPSLSSVKRVLERVGMVEKRRRNRPAANSGLLRSGRRAEGPNDVWSVDFKGWWHDPEGQRCEPLTVRDEHSRYILECQRMSSSRTEAVWDRFQRLFERHGLPKAIRSDNGPPFASIKGVLGLSKLSARWLALGIDLERSRPGCPQDNGAHERMHRDMSIELQRSGRGWSQASFDAWRQEYNHQRPHQALGMKTPAEFYAPSQRRYRGLPEDLDYPELEHRRRISVKGCMRWHQQGIFISEAIAEWSVGLQWRPDGLLDLYFANLLLGQIDPTTFGFRRAASGPAEAENPSATHT